MIRKLIHKLSNGNEWVFIAMFLAAIFVTILRLLAPIELWWDESVQLNAAHHLANGLGLTTTCSPGPADIERIPANLLEKPVAQYMNDFPPGLSLLVAGFLLLKIPLVFSLKIIYSLLTIIGWLCWAIIACRCLVRPIKLGRLSLPVQILVAAILPVFYTPGWRGTDLFLWAGLPYIILLLFNSSIRTKSAKCLLVAGLLLGLEFSFRFAALSLFIFAFFTLVQKNHFKIREIASKFAWFVGYSLIFIVPVVIYTIIASISNGSSGVNQVTFKSELYSGLGFVEIILKILQSASAISNLSGLPLQTGLAYKSSPSVYLYFVGGIFLLLVFLLPALASFTNQSFKSKQLGKNMLLTLSFIPVATVIFLFVCNVLGKYDFLGTPRYYVPAVLPAIFIFYALATNEKFCKFVKAIFLLFVVTFCIYNVAARPVGWKPILNVNFVGMGFRMQTSILNSYVSWKKDFSYPSNKILSLYDETSAKMRELQKENPDAIFFVSDCPVFVHDGYTGFRAVPVSEFWKKAEVNESVRVFWAVPQTCTLVCTSHGEEVFLGDKINESNFQLIFNSSKENSEKMKILVSDFPAGFRFS